MPETTVNTPLPFDPPAQTAKANVPKETGTTTAEISFSVTTRVEESKSIIEGQNFNIETPRPKITGYHSSLESKTDLFHIFPKDLDNVIIQSGEFSLTKSGGYWYSMQGEIKRVINGRVKVTQGFYTIGINKEGLIYHRCFYKKLPMVH